MALDIKKRESEIAQGEETVTHSLKPTQPQRSESLNGLWQGTRHPRSLATQGSHVYFSSLSLQPPCPAHHMSFSPLQGSLLSLPPLVPAACQPSTSIPCLNCGNDLLAHAPASIFIHPPHRDRMSSKVQLLPCPCSA